MKKKGQSKLRLPPPPRSGPGFRGLPASSIRTILERCSYRKYPPQHWLYRQGELGRNCYILKSGLITLTDLSAAGEETLIRFILPGDPLGFVAITDLEEYPLSAQVLQHSVVMTWDRETALKLLQEIPHAAANLLSGMISDFIYYYHHTRRLTMDPLEKRIEWGLRELSRVFGKPTAEGTVIEYGGLRQLAHLAGTNIYGVSRELSKLEDRGFLRKGRRRIVLLEPGNLHATARG